MTADRPFWHLPNCQIDQSAHGLVLFLRIFLIGDINCIEWIITTALKEWTIQTNTLYTACVHPRECKNQHPESGAGWRKQYINKIRNSSAFVWIVKISLRSPRKWLDDRPSSQELCNGNGEDHFGKYAVTRKRISKLFWKYANRNVGGGYVATVVRIW